MLRLVVLIILIFGLNNLFAQESNTLDTNNIIIGNKSNPEANLNYTLPELNGSNIGYREYINKKLRYPKDAKKTGIESTVYVKFLVDENGEIPIDSIKVVTPLFPSLDNEAIRVISKSPKWSPGTDAEGMPVQTWMVIAIIFTLNEK